VKIISHTSASCVCFECFRHTPGRALHVHAPLRPLHVIPALLFMSPELPMRPNSLDLVAMAYHGEHWFHPDTKGRTWFKYRRLRAPMGAQPREWTGPPAILCLPVCLPSQVLVKLQTASRSTIRNTFWAQGPAQLSLSAYLFFPLPAA